MNRSLHRDDIPVYLANILRVADTSGNASARESEVMQSIIDEIGATSEDVEAAISIMERGSNSIILPETTGARMENLQDMVMVALADGVITPNEAAPIEKIARKMRYSQADIDLALRRAESQLRKMDLSSVHKKEAVPKRQEITPPPPPLPEPTPKPQPPPPPESTQNYQPPPKYQPPESMPAPEDTPNYQPPPKYQPPDRKPLPKPPQPQKAETHPDTSGQKNVRTQALQPPAETVETCSACRADCEKPETYCFGMPDGPFNPWGCRLSGANWEAGEAWLMLGHFSDEATYIFDKKAIAEKLSEKLSKVTDCPYFKAKYAEAAFNALPQRVTIGERWDYRRCAPYTPNAVDLKTTRYIHGCPVSDSVTASAVDPVGLKDALKIIRKASRASGQHGEAYKTLREKI